MGTELIALVAAVSLISAGMLAIGLAVGYVRGRQRGQAEHANQPTDLEMLAEVGRAILSAQLRLEALCEIVYQQATKIVDTRDFQIGLYDGDDYLIKVWVRAGERLPETRFTGHANTGLIGYVRRSTQGLRVEDFRREWETLPARPTYDSTHPPRSALFVPLIAAGESIGVIAVQNDEPNAFSPESFRLLTLLANQAAGAIHNAQLYAQARDRANQLRLLNDFSRQITSLQALPNLFRQIVKLVDERFHYYAVSIFTYDPRTEQARLRASSHEEFDRRSLVLKRGEGLVGWVCANAQTLNVPDVSRDERYVQVAVLPQTRSEICIPLVMDKRVLGVLDVQSDQLNAFKPDDVAMLESLGGQLALALQEAQTYDAERRQAERINAMAEASRAVVSILDINALLDEVVDLVADYFGYDRVHLFLRIGERVVFRSGSGVHSGRWAADQLSYHITDNGFIPWVARTGQPLISGAVGADKRYVVGPGLDDSRSEMTVPIVQDGRVFGVFDIQSTEPDAFRPDDVTLVQALADTVAIGMRNASLFAEETRRRVLAETLGEVSASLVASRDSESTLDGLLDALPRVVEHDASLIMLRRDEENVYVVRAARGQIDETPYLDRIIPADDQALDHMWAILHELAAPEEGAERYGQDRLYAPMQVGGKEVGLLAIQRIGGDHFADDDIEIINTFANQAALALEGAQLFAAQQEEAWVTAALLSVAEAVNSTVELSQTLETIVRLTPMLAGVSRCAILTWDSDTKSLRGAAVWGIDDQLRDEFTHLTLSHHPLIDLILSKSEPTPIGTGTPHPIPEDLVRVLGLPALLALPLSAKGSLVGTMLVDCIPLRETVAQNRRFNILSGIAHQAALAIETGRLQEESMERQRLERELDVAERIQRSFLPQQLPHLPGWQVAAFYRAARQIGGDFYDFIPLKSGKWGIVIADVADKGVPAALFMALCRTNIRAAAFSRDDPVDTLGRVNELLLSDSRSDMFVTVWYGVWDPTTGEITYANTGHNPPLLIGADGASTELTAKGIALGVVEREKMRLERKTCQLAPGDVLVAYTDGITDALRADGAEFGLIGLHATVTAQRHCDAAEISKQVISALDSFMGDEPQFDDVTLVVLKRAERGDIRATAEAKIVPVEAAVS